MAALSLSRFLTCFALVIARIAVADDRLPPIAQSQMTPEQLNAAKALAATPRGATGLAGPFIPLLRSPELMNRLQRVGEYLRFQNSIGHKLTEFIILLTARQWTQQYEFNVHEKLAVTAGVAKPITLAIRDGRRPDHMDEDEAIAYEFFAELRQNQSVSDVTYARALNRFGERGVVDLTSLIGYYTTLAMIMNVSQTGLTPGSGTPLEAFPRGQ